MAIARVTSGVQDSLSTSSATLSLTVSGSNTLLVASVEHQGGAVTGCTWNGTAMTQIATELTNGSNRNLSLWYILNPAAGTHSLVASRNSSTGRISVVGAVYSGVSQSAGLVDSASGQGTGTSVTGTVTNIASGSLGLLTDWNIPNAGTNSTLVGATQSDSQLFENTNAASGSFSMSATATSSQQYGYIIAAFAPFTSTSVTATPSVVSLASAVIAPTITAVKNVTVAATVLACAASPIAPSVGVGASVSPTVLSASSSVIAPSVTAQKNVTVSATVLSFASGFASTSTSTGPNSPATAVDDATVGTAAWVNPQNVKASDAANAITSNSTSGVSETTNYLKATDFSFNIPNNATIVGILAEIERKASRNSTDSVRDSSVVILKADGTFGTTNKGHTAAGTDNWPTTDAYATYGSSADLWGETWTSDGINSPNFGVAISAYLSVGSVDVIAFINHIRISVYYTTAPATVSIGASSNPTIVSTTSAVITPTVSAQKNITVSTSVVSTTSALIAPTVIAGQSITASPTVAAASFVALSPSITANTEATATPSVVSVASSVLSPTLLYDFTVSPTPASGTFSVIPPTVDAQTGVIATPQVAAASFSVPAPSVSYGTTISPTAVSAAFQVITPHRMGSILGNIAKHTATLKNTAKHNATLSTIAKHVTTLRNIRKS